MKRLFIVFLSAWFALNADEISPTLSKAEDVLQNPQGTLANLEGGPDTFIHGCVNVITGDFQDSETDLVLPGSSPLIFHRSYSSSDHARNLLFHGWIHNLGSTLSQQYGTKHNYIVVKDSMSGQLVYSKHTRKQRLMDDLHVHSKLFKQGITNCGSGHISGRTNLSNHFMTWHKNNLATIYTGSGTTLEYICKQENNAAESKAVFCLARMCQPNGTQIQFRSEKILLPTRAVAVNQNGKPTQQLDIHYPEINKHTADGAKVKVKAFDGRTVTYTFKLFKGHGGDFDSKRLRLTHVDRPNGPPITYEYHSPSDSIEKVSKKILPDGRFLGVEYYSKVESPNKYTVGRVKALKAPVGPKKVINLYTFEYRNLDKHHYSGPYAETFVYDALNHCTPYKHSRDTHRLHSIQHFKSEPRGIPCRE